MGVLEGWTYSYGRGTPVVVKLESSLECDWAPVPFQHLRASCTLTMGVPRKKQHHPRTLQWEHTALWWSERERMFFMSEVQGYLAHKKPPTPLGPP